MNISGARTFICEVCFDADLPIERMLTISCIARGRGERPPVLLEVCPRHHEALHRFCTRELAEERQSFEGVQVTLPDGTEGMVDRRYIQ
jgi:hypothetical protein